MKSIYFYIPNLIDYARLISLFASFYYYDKDSLLFIIFYFCSFAFDLFDGMAARHFDQCSRFGSALDMITDRLSTAGLLIILSSFYKSYFMWFLGLVLLDVSSHWLQTYSSLLLISKNPDIVNHKELKEKFAILDLYYKNKFVLFNTCLWAEVFLLLLYLNHFYPFLMLNVNYTYFFYFTFAVYVFKQICSIFQLLGACDRIVDYDIEDKLKTKEIKGN